MPLELAPEIDETQFMTSADGVDDSADDGVAEIVAEPVAAADGKGTVVDEVIPAIDAAEEPVVDLWEGAEPPTSETRAKAPVAKKQPDRFEYQQSRADKAEAALKLAQEKLALLEPLERLALTDPTIIQKAVTQPVQAPPKEDTLTKPVRPTKPAGYDPVEAVTNPTSESAKFRFAMDEFNDSLAEYNEKKAEIHERQEAVAVARQQQAAQTRAQMTKLATELKAKYGFNGSQVQDFVKTVTSDEAMNLENLVRFYQVTKTSKTGVRRPAPNVQRIREPLPLSVLSGAPNETIDEQDAFNLGLLRNRRKAK